MAYFRRDANFLPLQFKKAKFRQLIIGKIFKIVATRCQI